MCIIIKKGNDDEIAPCMDTCQHRATTDLGSSDTYTATLNYDSGYLSTDCSVNPLSCTWNSVYVKYWYVVFHHNLHLNGIGMVYFI